MYIEVCLDRDSSEHGEVILRWFSECRQRLLNGLPASAGAWLASLTKGENDPSERFEGAPERENAFIKSLVRPPYWAQLGFHEGDRQLAWIRTSAAKSLDGHRSVTTFLNVDDPEMRDPDFCARLVEGLSVAADGSNPSFGRVEYGRYSDRANLEVALRRKPREFLPMSRSLLRGYGWVTVCPEELVARLGGVQSLERGGAFFRVIPLSSGGAVLQASETLHGYSDEVMDTVFSALATVLPSGTPRAHIAFPDVRFVHRDAGEV
ncbi:hypothetical protein GCM10010277_81230 [Streptomyces longisporoflavus]|uniref:hypothetical protein n=1 Tax=Streptomyces longisporoflavus TaxID=28044 RepID=UPI00167CA447|nr:hypothetical protein [Streptomyces longisporoflavus]GGV70359.1 hypothetical protein GCM10010277_81230 [Streptomyces longisporoflavus]